jgi:hypothetical protein
MTHFNSYKTAGFIVIDSRTGMKEGSRGFPLIVDSETSANQQ